jgi:hypothetical protein
MFNKPPLGRNVAEEGRAINLLLFLEGLLRRYGDACLQVREHFARPGLDTCRCHFLWPALQNFRRPVSSKGEQQQEDAEFL